MPLSSVVGAQSIVKPGVCTSSTRPASPFDGQVIYETDTDKTLVYNGTGWVYLSTSRSNPVGLDLITTQTIGTSVGTFDVSGCFSSTYDNYKIQISNTTFSTTTAGVAVLLSGSTPQSSGWYGSTAYVTSAGTTINVAALTNNGYFEYGSLTANSKNTFSFEVLNPYLPNYTRTSFSSADDNYWRWGAHCHRANTSYDGIRIGSYGGNFTGGTVSVYGYVK